MNKQLFESIFNKFKSDCYIIEINLDAKCSDNSLNCRSCLGTGYIVSNVYKDSVLIDKGYADISLPNTNRIQSFGKYYSDGRVAYFSSKSNFDLSAHIKRIVVNVINNKITDMFYVEYLEPIISKNEIVYYKGSIVAANIDNTNLLSNVYMLIESRWCKWLIL